MFQGLENLKKLPCSMVLQPIALNIFPAMHLLCTYCGSNLQNFIPREQRRDVNAMYQKMTLNDYIKSSDITVSFRYGGGGGVGGEELTLLDKLYVYTADEIFYPGNNPCDDVSNFSSK